MSLWDRYGVEADVRRVLAGATGRRGPGHHFDAPYLSAYQLVIELSQMGAPIAVHYGRRLGGKGLNEHSSLAQYVANQLSKRIKSGQISDIEGAFISSKHLVGMTYRTT